MSVDPEKLTNTDVETAWEERKRALAAIDAAEEFTPEALAGVHLGDMPLLVIKEPGDPVSKATFAVPIQSEDRTQIIGYHIRNVYYPVDVDMVIRMRLRYERRAFVVAS